MVRNGDRVYVALEAPRDQVQTRLRELLAMESDVESGAVGPNSGTTHRAVFLSWLDQVTEFTAHAFKRTDPPPDLASPHIVALQGDAVTVDRLHHVIRAEMRAIDGWLRAAQSTLDGLLRGSWSGRVLLVIDTNTLLHFRALDQIRWGEVAGAPAAVGIPLVVLDELDKHKNNRDAALARRARTAGKLIERLLSAADASSVATLPDSSGLLILPEAESHIRAPNPDDEVIVAARTVIDRGELARLVTNDLSMRTRARARGIELMELPDDHRLPREDQTDRELRETKAELGALRNQTPQVRVVAADGGTLLHPQPLSTPRTLDVAAVGRNGGYQVEALPGLEASELGANRFFPAAQVEHYTPEQVREYNRARDSYLIALKAWAENANLRAIRMAGAVVLKLGLTNSGQTTAHDVEVEITLDDESDMMLTTKAALTIPDPPEEPKRPASLFGSMPALYAKPFRMPPMEFGPIWEINDGRAARLTVPKVRHGGGVIPVRPDLYAVSSTSEPGTGEVPIHWGCLGASPSFTNQGDIHLLPRTRPSGE